MATGRIVERRPLRRDAGSPSSVLCSSCVSDRAADAMGPLLEKHRFEKLATDTRTADLATRCLARVSRFLADEIVRSPSTPEESARKYSFSLRLEGSATSFVGRRCVRRFSLLRHLGANLRHEKRRGNAGAKHRLRCRWEDLQPPCRRESSQGFAERSLTTVYRGGVGARGHAIL